MTEAEFLPLFDQYHNMVYRLALTSLRSAHDAEDMVQTVFLKLLSSPSPPAPGKEKAWLAQVTVNGCRDLARSRKRWGWEPLDENIPFSQPDQPVFDAPEQGELYQAVMALPEKLRVTVPLHYYEGYSHREIAQILHISPSAVSMRLHRARNLLRNSLKEDGYGPAISEPF